MSKTAATDKGASVLPTADHEQWDEFVQGCDDGSPFHCAWWHTALGARFEIVASRAGDGSIVAGAPVHRTRFLGASSVRPPDLTPLNHPLIQPQAVAAAAVASQRRRELAGWLAQLPKAASHHLLFGDTDFDPAPLRAAGFDLLVAWTYVIDGRRQEPWRSFASSTRRRKLRKAAKEAAAAELHVVRDATMDEVLPLLADTADVKGYAMKGGGAHLLGWWEEVRRRQAGGLYALRDSDHRVVGATVLVWSKTRAWYLGGGMASDLRSGGNLNGLLFEAMIDDTLEAGRAFDFEGSVIPGVDRFFREWGGEQRRTVRAVKLGSPLISAAWHGHGWLTRHRRPVDDGTAGKP